jgi:hypothetical protein
MESDNIRRANWLEWCNAPSFMFNHISGQYKVIMKEKLTTKTLRRSLKAFRKTWYRGK